MGIKLNWDDQSAQQLTAIEIYRSTSPISSSNPGTPLVSLPGSATSYEDNTVKNKSRYYYRIAAVKGNDKSFSPNQLAGYFAETGPGRATPLRGDWNAGLMEIMTPANFTTMAAVKAKVPSMSAITIGEPSSWYKMCYQGKIIYVPNGNNVNASWQTLYNAGLVYGTDDFGQTPTGVPGSVKQRTTVNIGGLDYIIRLPRLSNIPLNQYLSATDDTIGGEFRDTAARLVMSTGTPVNGQKSRLYDATTGLLALGPHLYSPGNAGAHLAASQEVLSYGGITTNYIQILILELVMP